MSWEKSRSKWRAQVTVDGKSRSLGYFTDETAAANVAAAARQEEEEEEEEEEEYTVEKILSKLVTDGRTEYLVKWAGAAVAAPPPM